MGDRSDKVRGKARLASDIATVDLTGGERNAEPTPATAFDRPQDRFEHLGELGRGGMGRVDDAYDRTLGRPVAIKHMLAQSAVDFARFEREARITARLEHPGIVPIHEAGRSPDGTPYYVMRRVDGRPLNELVTDKSLAERLRLIPNVLAACDAAGYAHSHGVVHRDIKPSNILVGPFGETLLIDWGLARELDSGETSGGRSMPSDQALTRAGTVAGTPGFMSPEQARGESVDARADVFALGATLFYVLSGSLPWGSTSATELVNLAGANRAPDWKRVPREVPPDLRAVLEKAMAMDPAERYPDAVALAADLRRFTLGNLVAAYEYGPIAKLVRYARKHRAAVGVGLISFAVVVIIGVISVRRIVAERDDARAARTLAEARQREAMTMADELLVQHARELAESDPAAAIAALRRLRPESAHWRQAWAAATMAWLRGIPIGFVGTLNPAMMAVSPDNRHAFVLELTSGNLAIHDLEARTRRTVAHGGGPVSNPVWLDSRYIAGNIVAKKALGFIDTQTGELVLVPMAINQIHGSGGTGIWVQQDDGTVLAYTEPHQPPTTVMTNIDKVFPSANLHSAVVARGRRTEVWFEGRTYPLPTQDAIWSASIRDGTAATLHDDHIRGWKLSGGKLVTIGEWPRDNIVHVRIILDHVIAITHAGLRAFTAQGPSEFESKRPELVYDVRRGIVMTTHEGSIIIRDESGRFEIGQRPIAYSRVDLSNDGRWLAALAKTGELLVWDLREIRPSRIPIGPLEQPMRIDGDFLWLADLGSGVREVELSTGKSRDLLGTHAVPPMWATSGKGGKFIATGNWSLDLLSVYDGVRDKAFIMRDVTRAAEDLDGLLIARRDGTLLRWRAGEVGVARYGKLPSAPDALAFAGRYAVARIGLRELVHFDTATQTVTRVTTEDKIDSVGIDYAGVAMYVGNGRAFRWYAGSPPVELETAGPVDDILPVQHGVLLHSASSIILLRGSDRRVIPLSSIAMSHVSADAVLVFETPHRQVGLIDVETGSTVLFPLKKPIMSHITADETRVVYREAQDVKDTALLMWTLRVPRDPVQLRAWLGQVSNARPIPNSDAVAYP